MAKVMCKNVFISTNEEDKKSNFTAIWIKTINLLLR